jgi:hypothetical protein
MPTSKVVCGQCNEDTIITHAIGVDIMYCPVCGHELCCDEVSNDA